MKTKTFKQRRKNRSSIPLGIIRLLYGRKRREDKITWSRIFEGLAGATEILY